MAGKMQIFEKCWVFLVILAGIHVSVNSVYLYGIYAKQDIIQVQFLKILQMYRETNLQAVENDEKIRVIQRDREKRTAMMDDLIKKVDTISHTVDRLDRTINPPINLPPTSPNPYQVPPTPGG